MLGYECPSCTVLISQSKPGERRQCPTCWASIFTQGIAWDRRTTKDDLTEQGEK